MQIVIENPYNIAAIGCSRKFSSKEFNPFMSSHNHWPPVASEPNMSQAEALNLLSSRGNLVKRPFLLGDSFGLVGFKEDLWLDALT